MKLYEQMVYVLRYQPRMVEEARYMLISGLPGRVDALGRPQVVVAPIPARAKDG